MKKSFIMIELIIVIVIMSVLVAISVPKFLNLKQHSESANVAKVTLDAVKSAINIAVKLRDLEGNNSFKLKDLVNLDGKGWKYFEDASHPYGFYNYRDSKTDASIAGIILDRENHIIIYGITCSRFSDPKTQEKCREILGGKDQIYDEISY